MRHVQVLFVHAATLALVLLLCISASAGAEESAGAVESAGPQGKIQRRLEFSGVKRWDLSMGWYIGDRVPIDPARAFLLPPLGLAFMQSLEVEATGQVGAYEYEAYWNDDRLFSESLMFNLWSPTLKASLGPISDWSLLPVAAGMPPFTPGTAMTGIDGRLDIGNTELRAVLARPVRAREEERILLQPEVVNVSLCHSRLEPGSEAIYLEGRRLVPGLDYSIDYNTGDLWLHWAVEKPVILAVSYTYEETGLGAAQVVRGLTVDSDIGRWQVFGGYLGVDSKRSSSQTPVPSQDMGAIGLGWESPNGEWKALFSQALSRHSYSDHVLEDFESWQTQLPIFPSYWLTNWQSEAGVGSSIGATMVESSGDLTVGYSLAGGSWGRCEYSFADSIDFTAASSVIMQGTNTGMPAAVELEFLTPGGSFIMQDSIGTGEFVKVWPRALWTSLGIPEWSAVTGVGIAVHNSSSEANVGELVITRLERSEPVMADERWSIVQGSGTLQVLDGPGGEQVLNVRPDVVGDVGIATGFPSLVDISPYTFLGFSLSAENWSGHLTIVIKTTQGELSTSVFIGAPGWHSFSLPLAEFEPDRFAGGDAQDGLRQVTGLRIEFSGTSPAALINLDSLFVTGPSFADRWRQTVDLEYGNGSGFTFGTGLKRGTDGTETKASLGFDMPGRPGELRLESFWTDTAEGIGGGYQVDGSWYTPGLPWTLAVMYQRNQSASGGSSTAARVVTGWKNGSWKLDSSINSIWGAAVSGDDGYQRTRGDFRVSYSGTGLSLAITGSGAIDSASNPGFLVSRALDIDLEWKYSYPGGVMLRLSGEENPEGDLKADYTAIVSGAEAFSGTLKIEAFGRIRKDAHGSPVEDRHVQEIEYTRRGKAGTRSVRLGHELSAAPSAGESPSQFLTLHVGYTPADSALWSLYGEVGYQHPSEAVLGIEVGGSREFAVEWGRLNTRVSLRKQETLQAQTEVWMFAPLKWGLELESQGRLSWAEFGIAIHLRSGLIWRF